MTTYPAPRVRGGIDGMTLAAFLLIGFGALMVYRDISSHNEIGLPSGKSDEIQDAQLQAKPQKVDSEVGSGLGPPESTDMERRVAPPYAEYTLTQGLHGFSYGHMAIDLSAGKGAIIKSPILGYVSELYTDQYGNPTLPDNLADGILLMISGDHRGVYHIAGADYMSRWAFALKIAKIFELNQELIAPVLSAQLSQRAPRPHWGGLRVDRAARQMNLEVVGVQDGLTMMRKQLPPGEMEGL